MFLPWSILSWIWIYQKFLSWGHIVFCHHQNTISYVFCMYLVYFAYITWQYRVPLKFYHSTFRRMFQPKLFENSQVGLRWVWPTDYGLPMKPFPCFPLFNHYFYKKLSLYIHNPHMFGLQRIRDLAFLCP
jgi:hypothetical protein